jgi:hypothetical protein
MHESDQEGIGGDPWDLHASAETVDTSMSLNERRPFCMQLTKEKKLCLW